MKPRNRIWSMACVALLSAASLLAQEPKWEQMQASGKLVRLVPGGLQVAAEKGDQWNVKLPDNPKYINYVAEADTDFLKPDMMIRFSAIISSKGLVVSEVSSITVFTPQEPGDIGLAPEGGGNNPADALFGTDTKEEKPKPKKGPEQLPYTIGGQIVSVKGKKMVVSAGGTVLKCDLAENTKVSVSVADLSYAKIGDKVEVEGRYLADNKPAGAWARSVSITAANPLVNSKKKPKTTAKTDAKTAEKSEEKAEEKK